MKVILSMENEIIDFNFRPFTYSHPNELAKLACQRFKIKRSLHEQLLHDAIYEKELSLYINDKVNNHQYFYTFDEKPEINLVLASRSAIVKVFYMAVLLSNHDSLCAIIDKQKLLNINKLISSDELSILLNASPKQKSKQCIRGYFPLRYHIYHMLCEMISTWLLLLPSPLSTRMRLKLPSRYTCSIFSNQFSFFENLLWVLERQ